jgi:hypothetical protein
VVYLKHITLVAMNDALRSGLTQFHFQCQHELFPLIESGLGTPLNAQLQRVLRILEMIGIERFIPSGHGHVGRPRHDRIALARAYVARAVLGLSRTIDLIERLKVDVLLRRLCGFEPRSNRSLNATLFSRAFAEFADMQLPARVHEALVREQSGDALVGHLSLDATAIEAREKPRKPDGEPAPAPRKRGRPRKGEVREPPALTRIERQFAGMSLDAMLADLPTHCAVGAKCNAQGYKNCWNGYKLHLNVADGMIPVAAILTSASLHDSQVAIPLATMSAQRVTSLYDLRDAAYCSPLIRAHSESLGHVPLIDHNPRGGEKIEFAPHQAARYRERSTVERVNAHLKDNFGCRNFYLRGHTKVFAHLMFAVLALTAEQLMRRVPWGT